MLTKHLTWHAGRVLPKKNDDSVDESDVVVVTFDGKSISAVAVYNYKVGRWYDIGHGKYLLIDKPLYWAYAELESPIVPKSKINTLVWSEQKMRPNMTFLGVLSCTINTLIVGGMITSIIKFKQYVFLALLLIVVPALAGQWYLLFRKRK